MIDRLANVIYWICTALAVFCIGIGLYGAFNEAGNGGVWIIAIMGGAGVGIWLIGRAARYVLSGR